MRIITQDRAHDIPYEKVCISIVGNTLIAYDTNFFSNNDYWTLGIYADEDRAEKVAKAIRKAYQDLIIYGTRVDEFRIRNIYIYMPEE